MLFTRTFWELHRRVQGGNCHPDVQKPPAYAGGFCMNRYETTKDVPAQGFTVQVGVMDSGDVLVYDE